MKTKKYKWLLSVGVALLLGIAVLANCGPTEQEPVFTDDTAYIIVAERLINMAQTAEAKEYIAFLFPSIPEGDFVERHNNLSAWKYIVDYWPLEARDAFQSAKWFTGDYEKHFSLIKRPTWVIYDNGDILPLGGAIIVEADIDRLSTKRILE